MSSRTGNHSELRRIVSPAIRRAVVPAVKAGQAVLLAGMVRRCPRSSHKLVRSIHATRVGIGSHSAGGAVVVGTRYALAVEYGPHKRPFVGPTKHQDGPKAERAMARELLKRLG